MPVNTWGRDRSNRPVVHIRKDGAKGLYAKAMCEKLSHQLVDVRNYKIASCKRCQKVMAEQVALANEVLAEVIAEEKNGKQGS